MWLSFLNICNAEDTQTLNIIRQVLAANSEKSVQEKVYLHLDNTCYFVGDTIWYKAYVTRADNLRETDMSRILYVELLTPDGFVKERQNIIIDNDGFSSGCIPLQDSLYSGYYELRAYTRWMLNFNVTEHRYGKEVKDVFYNKDMAKDFFRQWDGLYSRVFPVYSKPENAGDFSYKRMYSRPKQRIMAGPKEKLVATFYPEGGHLLRGVENRVAFELTTQDGEAVDLEGQVVKGEMEVCKLKTEYMGRGSFLVTPGEENLTARFLWNDKEYAFDLPKSEIRGVTLRLDSGVVSVSSVQLPSDRQCGLSILCRGVLKHFEEIHFESNGIFSFSLPTLPTGVNDLTIFDSHGNILADRLFFINNHDYDSYTVQVDSGMKSSLAPYEAVTLNLQCQDLDTVTSLSVAVRDTQTDEPSYNDGNIMTDMLLGSELKGFVARPAYYFETDDQAHRQALDLLMMVQGWRKYPWTVLADSGLFRKRYTPEETMTVEGCVYKLVNQDTDLSDGVIDGWKDGSTTDHTVDSDSSIPLRNLNVYLKGNRGERRTGNAVWVEAELVVGKDVAGLSRQTEPNGRFLFQIPPFYGVGVLNMTAYAAKDSVKKSLETGTLKGFLDETKWPDYYVKRDLFYPRFCVKYGFYQNHIPDKVTTRDTLSNLWMENTDVLLRNVNVKGKRRGKRGIDYRNPAYVEDAYTFYNEVTDYGLSYGVYNKALFPVQICHYLFGNMGRYNRFNVDGKIDDDKFKNYTFYRNYTPEKASVIGMSGGDGKPIEKADTYNSSPTRSDILLEKTLQLKRLSDIRVFTDYEPRNEDAPVDLNSMRADATVVYTLYPNDSEQVTYRDRHIVLQGFDFPLDFYHPDYSRKKPSRPTDYRRTLYWNPHVKTDDKGKAQITFFNNSKETRIKVDVCGITSNGHFIRTE